MSTGNIEQTEPIIEQPKPRLRDLVAAEVAAQTRDRELAKAEQDEMAEATFDTKTKTFSHGIAKRVAAFARRAANE